MLYGGVLCCMVSPSYYIMYGGDMVSSSWYIMYKQNTKASHKSLFDYFNSQCSCGPADLGQGFHLACPSIFPNFQSMKRRHKPIAKFLHAGSKQVQYSKSREWDIETDFSCRLLYSTLHMDSGVSLLIWSENG